MYTEMFRVSHARLYDVLLPSFEIAAELQSVDPVLPHLAPALLARRVPEVLPATDRYRAPDEVNFYPCPEHLLYWMINASPMVRCRSNVWRRLAVSLSAESADRIWDLGVWEYTKKLTARFREDWIESNHERIDALLLGPEHRAVADLIEAALPTAVARQEDLQQVAQFLRQATADEVVLVYCVLEDTDPIGLYM